MSLPSRPRPHQVTRRHFLKSTAATTAAASTLGGSLLKSQRTLAAERLLGANERITIGAIGVGGRARQLLEQLPESAQIVALADCNLPRAEEFKSEADAAWDVYQDYRYLLDRQDIDAVIVATGEFQRVLPCIHAAQAGKDIYAEKPLTLYVREGRALVDAVRKHERILQVGTQQRSMAINRIACELVRSSGLGNVLKVRAMNYSGAEASPTEYPSGEETPTGLDWDMWLNQAAWREYHPDWMGWMRWRDFAGGEMTNWGAHGIDQIQWALGTDHTGPVAMWPLTDGPSGQVAMRYAHGVEVEFVLEPGSGPMGGAVFICEGGKLEINRNKFASNPPEIAMELKRQLDLAEEQRKWSDDVALWQARWHLQDWLDCIRSRELPVADVEIGHRSVTVCHLANITRAVGRPLTWDPHQERFVNDSEANEYLDRPRRERFELPAASI